MFTLLFDSSFWYGIVAIVAIILIIALCFKYPQSRVYVASLFIIALLAGTAYCGIQLNYYYSAEGGIHGKLTNLFAVETNKGEELTDGSFKLTNIMMTQEGDTDKFSATITFNNRTQFHQEQNYMILINGEPTMTTQNISESTSDFSAVYTYQFKDDEGKIKLTDDLHINLSYYANGSRLKIYTQGNQTAVNCWNNYFNRNNCIVKVVECAFDNSINGSTTESEMTDVCTITYYLDGVEYMTVAYPNSTTILTLPEPIKDGYKFKGWAVNENATAVITSLNLTENTNLYAVFEEAPILFTGEYTRTFSSQQGNTLNLSEICLKDISNVDIKVTLKVNVNYAYGGMNSFEGTLSKDQPTITNTNYYNDLLTISLSNGVVSIDTECTEEPFQSISVFVYEISRVY